jgi:hypothetical protein
LGYSYIRKGSARNTPKTRQNAPETRQKRTRNAPETRQERARNAPETGSLFQSSHARRALRPQCRLGRRDDARHIFDPRTGLGDVLETHLKHARNTLYALGAFLVRFWHVFDPFTPRFYCLSPSVGTTLDRPRKSISAPLMDCLMQYSHFWNMVGRSLPDIKARLPVCP